MEIYIFQHVSMEAGWTYIGHILSTLWLTKAFTNHRGGGGGEEEVEGGGGEGGGEGGGGGGGEELNYIQAISPGAIKEEAHEGRGGRSTWRPRQAKNIQDRRIWTR